MLLILLLPKAQWDAFFSYSTSWIWYSQVHWVYAPIPPIGPPFSALVLSQWLLSLVRLHNLLDLIEMKETLKKMTKKMTTTKKMNTVWLFVRENEVSFLVSYFFDVWQKRGEKFMSHVLVVMYEQCFAFVNFSCFWHVITLTLHLLYPYHVVWFCLNSIYLLSCACALYLNDCVLPWVVLYHKLCLRFLYLWFMHNFRESFFTSHNSWVLSSSKNESLLAQRLNRSLFWWF